MLGLCLFTAACGNAPGPIPPTAPSGVNGITGAQVQATGGPNIEVTFTKWIDPSFPLFKGVAGGDVPGDFAATVLQRTPFDNGNIIDLRARYEVLADNTARSFVAEIEGKQNNQTLSAVLNGSVVDGVRIPPNIPVDIRNSSLITIAPFQIVAHLDLVETRRVSDDPGASTPVRLNVVADRGRDPVDDP